MGRRSTRTRKASNRDAAHRGSEAQDPNAGVVLNGQRHYCPTREVTLCVLFFISLNLKVSDADSVNLVGVIHSFGLAAAACSLLLCSANGRVAVAVALAVGIAVTGL